MYKLLFKLTLCFVLFNGIICRYTDSTVKEWNLFKEKFKKSYTDNMEEESKMNIFMDNLKNIEEHNKLYEEGKVTFKRGVHEYSDMRPKEFIKERCGLVVDRERKNKSKRLLSTMLRKDDDSPLPDSLDWRTEGAVTPVKDQRNCGSCWAFSATGALEGQLYQKTGKLTGLSEQNLVDCAWLQGNRGCRGGDMPWAFQYVKDNDGISKETYYPYEGRNNLCRYFFLFRATGCDEYVELPRGDEDELKRVLATVGPVAVSFDVQDAFFDYSEGVYYEEDCDPDWLNHGMLAVGYDTTEDGQDYWIIKNSWGTSWGDEGYIKVARNKNTCGIGNENSYPIV